MFLGDLTPLGALEAPLQCEEDEFRVCHWSRGHLYQREKCLLSSGGARLCSYMAEGVVLSEGPYCARPTIWSCFFQFDCSGGEAKHLVACSYCCKAGGC